MLDKIRRPGRFYKDGTFKKIFTYTIFGLICLVFLFIAPMGINLTGQGVAGQVGNHYINQRELKTLEENLRNQYKSQLEQADEERSLQLQKEIRSRALLYLVRLYLINSALHKEGVFLTDEELAVSIRSIPIFQEKGRFLKSRYQTYLKIQKLRPHQFQESIRREQLAKNWEKTFNQALIPNELEKEKKQARYKYKVSFRYVTLNATEVKEEELEPFVKSKNKPEIEKFLKTIQAKWEKTDAFSLFMPLGVPIAQNEIIMNKLISQLPKKGLIPELIRDDKKIFLVEVLSFVEEDTKPEKKHLEALFSQNFEKSLRLFDSWLILKREQIKVQINSDNI